MDKKEPITYGLEADMKLLQFLRSKSSERFSKLDAFCDLIGRMPVNSATQPEDDRVMLLPYRSDTFRATITELAEHWRWHRATVRTFLDGLENLGYLSKLLDGKEYIFSIHTLTNVDVPIKNCEQLRTLTMHLLYNNEVYKLTDLQLSTYFKLYMRVFASKKGDMSDEDYQKEVVEVKTNLILDSLTHLDINMGVILNKREAIVPLVRSTFERQTPWSWEKWMAAVAFLNLAVYDKDFPDKDNPVAGNIFEMKELVGFSDEDVDLLKTIYDCIVQCRDYLFKEDDESNSSDESSSSSLTSNEDVTQL